MKNKILKTGIVFVLVIMLTGVSSVIAMNESKPYDTESVAPVLPVNAKKIGEIKYGLHCPGSTVAANLIKGQVSIGEGKYYVKLEIDLIRHDSLWGVWASLDYSIIAVNRDSGETITFFDVKDRIFEFTDNPPFDYISEEEDRTIPKGRWIITAYAYGHFKNKHCDQDDPGDECNWVVTKDYEKEDEESKEYIFPKDTQLTINLIFHNRPAFNLLTRLPFLARLLR